MVMENILKFENGSRSLLIQPGFRSLLFHASHDEMMTSVREGLADHIHNLPPTGATEVGEEPEEEIGAVTRESEHSKGIGSTLSETEVAAIPHTRTGWLRQKRKDRTCPKWWTISFFSVIGNQTPVSK